MTLQEVMQLPVARVCHDGNPRCFACAPIRGDHPNQFVDFDAGTTMAIDPERPAVCICPQCDGKAQTPPVFAIDVLTQQVAALKEAWFREQLARDPIAQAELARRIREGA